VRHYAGPSPPVKRRALAQWRASSRSGDARAPATAHGGDSGPRVDTIAEITTAPVVVPQAMAYATTARLPRAASGGRASECQRAAWRWRVGARPTGLHVSEPGRATRQDGGDGIALVQ
jgi:hypothetical protein